jgi:shikimate kinase
MSGTSKPIILIGFMGSGKTTIGKILAKKLGRDFIDTDELIEKEAGISISEIFKNYGEGYFRTLEREIISKVLENTNSVIATGGGCVTQEKTRRLLKENGVVIWLNVVPETVLARTEDDITRPLLNKDKENKIYTLLFEREPFYRETAHYEINANESLGRVISEIESILKREGFPITGEDHPLPF